MIQKQSYWPHIALNVAKEIARRNGPYGYPNSADEALSEYNKLAREMANKLDQEWVQ